VSRISFIDFQLQHRAQTRASPPHQAKNGLDGDPGVWAYVGIAKFGTSRN
jgi:hypothetical protein